MDEPKAGDQIQKVLVGHTVKRNQEKGTYTFTISSGSVDRDADTIDPNGWKLENYRANPVVLFGHQSSQPPIGRAENVGARSGALKADVVFAEPGTYDLADTVRSLVDQDILRATSVGFIPIKWTFDEERGGVDFLEQELYEFSIVPIPSNADALRDSKGVDLAPLIEWCELTLDAAKGPGLWVSKDVAEHARKIAAGEPASITVPDAGEVAQGEAHAPADSGSTPEPATPKARQPLRVLRKRKVSITRDQVRAAVQRAVKEEVQAAVRYARGRLD